MLVLPFPEKILWPNGRGHHMAVHRAFQKHKQWARLATLSESVRAPIASRIEWTATFYPKTANAIDDDNARASLKAYQDGIALALGVDDRVFAAPTIRFGKPEKPGRVEIEVLG